MPSTVEALQGEVYPRVLAAGLRKARRRLIPLLAICYLVAYMDRVNISFAAESMNHDLHFTPKIYGLGAGVFFLSYALCEVPSNWLLLHFGARRWMARIMLTWGLVAAAMVLIRSPASFYSMRLLLGVAEAGFFPGAIYYLSIWFPAAQRARAISLFYVAFPLSNVVMGGLAGVLLRQNGRLGLAGWQWLFLVEALPAILLSAVVWCLLPDGPEKAAWLTPEEREAIQREVRRDGVSTGGHEASQKGVLLRVLRNPLVWVMGLFYFLTLGSNYGVTFSLPTILKGATGWDAGRVGYLVAGYGLAGALAMWLNASHSDGMRERRLHVMAPAAVMAAALLAAAMHLAGWPPVVALLLASMGFYALQGPTLSLWPMLVEGDSSAVAIATLNMCGIVGGFVGPYWMGYLREATGSYAVGVGCMGLAVLVGVVSVSGLMRRFATVPAGEPPLKERSV
jgi:ACS family tartrate transporter-like MFS transporter